MKMKLWNFWKKIIKLVQIQSLIRRSAKINPPTKEAPSWQWKVLIMFVLKYLQPHLQNCKLIPKIAYQCKSKTISRKITPFSSKLGAKSKSCLPMKNLVTDSWAKLLYPPSRKTNHEHKYQTNFSVLNSEKNKYYYINLYHIH